VKQSASDLSPPSKMPLAKPRTVEHHETGHGLPDPSPPRVGAYADKDGEEGHDAESDGEMGQEVTTLEVGVHCTRSPNRPTRLVSSALGVHTVS
jgi:hypothetical protein